MLFEPAVTMTCDIDNASASCLVRARGVLPTMDYKRMLGPKGVGFSGFGYINANKT